MTMFLFPDGDAFKEMNRQQVSMVEEPSSCRTALLVQEDLTVSQE